MQGAFVLARVGSGGYFVDGRSAENKGDKGLEAAVVVDW